MDFYPLYDDLFAFMRSNKLAKAALLLREYEKTLKQEGYSPAEIGRLLTRLRTLISK